VRRFLPLSVLLLAACGSPAAPSATAPSAVPSAPSSQTISTTKGTYTVPGNAFIDGRTVDTTPVATVINVKVYEGVPTEQVVCTIKHGQLVRAVNVQELDGQTYVRVQRNNCAGWVNDTSLNGRQAAAEGEEIEE
jgi:hypothetical protein